MSKTLFIENSPFLTRLVVSDELKESISIKQGKNNTLIVKNIPGTILNRTNQNGRIYSTAEIQRAIDAARPQIETKQLLCSCDEHPEGSFVSPSHAAFVIIGAYIKKNVKLEVEGEKGTYDVLFCDIEVLNTSEGKNLQALLLSGCSLGTSIRGLGDMDGDQVVNYEFLGFDIVSNPSSGTFTNMPIYEAKIESVEENALNEATKFTVSTYASNTTHDLNQAMEFQNKASTSLEYGTITNMNTKMDQEVDPKTGVEKTVGEVEVETSDDTSDLKTALEIAGRAFTNPDNINVTSITIEKVDEDDMKDSVMQGGASDTLKEEDGEWVVRLVDTDNNECFAGEKESELVNDIAAAKKFSTQEEAEMFKAKYPADVESVDPDTGIVTHYVSVETKNIKENEELPQEAPVEEQVLKEVEISQGMWIKTELLDPTAVYYVDEVTDAGVYLIKNSETGHRIFIETDGSYIFPWEEVKDEEEPVEEALTDDGTISQDGNTLSIDVDGNEIEKDFRTDEEAKIAKAGLENGELAADIMYDESSSWWALKVTAGDFADWYVTEKDGAVDVTSDDNLALMFPTEEEAKQYQQDNGCEEYEYENGLRTDVVPVQLGITDDEIFGKQEETDMDEKLYADEDPASDSFENNAIIDEVKDIKVTLGEISYDIDDEPDFEGDPKEIEELLENHLPETVELQLNGGEIPEEDAEQYIYEKAREQTGLPIKNATIIDIQEIEDEAKKEDMNLDASDDMVTNDAGGLEDIQSANDTVINAPTSDAEVELM